MPTPVALAFSAPARLPAPSDVSGVAGADGSAVAASGASAIHANCAGSRDGNSEHSNLSWSVSGDCTLGTILFYNDSKKISNGNK